MTLTVAARLFVLVMSPHAFGNALPMEWHLPTRMPVQSSMDREHIIRQTTDRTCGPATLATLLHYYFGKSVTEAEIYHLALATMLGEQSEIDVMPSITLRGLMGALAHHGFQGHPVQTTFDDLEAYFERYEIPIVLRIYHPTPHFTLLIGMVDNLFILSDSMLGQFTMSKHELKDHWDNYALFVMPVGDFSFKSEFRLEKLAEVQQRSKLLNQIRMFI